LLVFGSCECDQFEYVEDIFESKNPVYLSRYFATTNKSIYKVACGSLHTILLLTNGEVYSFGCNDDMALGRDTKQEGFYENVPGLVKLPERMDMIAAGDCHSITCNINNSIIYYWGKYRNSKGNISESKFPE